MEEKIHCKICSYSALKSLQAHINRTHKMSIRDYLRVFPDAKILSDSFYKFISDKNRLQNKDPIIRLKMSIGVKKLWADPEYRVTHSLALKKGQNTPKAIENHRRGAKNHFLSLSEEDKQKRKEIMKDSWEDPENRVNRVNALQKAHKKDSVRLRHSEATKRNYKGLSLKQKQERSANLKRVWAIPENREKILELSKIGLEKANSVEGRINRDLANLRPDVKEKRSRIAMDRLLKQPKISKLSLRFKDALNASGLFPEPEQAVGKFVVDFLFRKENIVVEIDGDFWHANPAKYELNNLNKIQKRVVNKDKLEKNYCLQNNISLLRFWEADINKDINVCINKVQEALNGQK